jgi:hypothetical protein
LVSGPRFARSLFPSHSRVPRCLGVPLKPHQSRCLGRVRKNCQGVRLPQSLTPQLMRLRH